MATSIKAIKDYFGMKPGQSLKDFAAEWSALPEADKEQIRQGIDDGTLTY